jgi:hypothetical protein
MGDHNAAMRPEFGQPAWHRLVIAENPVAMQFHPTGKATADIIEREGPQDVSGELDALPGGEVIVNLPARFADFGFHRLDLGIEVEIVLVRMVLQILEPPLQFQDRLFEIKRMEFHFG